MPRRWPGCPGAGRLPQLPESSPRIHPPSRVQNLLVLIVVDQALEAARAGSAQTLCSCSTVDGHYPPRLCSPGVVRIPCIVRPGLP